MTFLSIFVAKLINIFSRMLNLGAGGTWPGEMALRIEPKILSYLARQLKYSILIAGTNGKTTTAKMIETVLSRHSGKPEGRIQNQTFVHINRADSGQARMTNYRVVHNASGANLLNGITSALIQKTDILGKVQADIGVFEVDEASLPLVLNEFTPSIVVLLNLFRDQLDRYGEVDIIAEKWLESLKKLPSSATVIINADDPHLAFIGNQLKAKVLYFGIGDKKEFLKTTPHAVDTIYCPKCGKRLVFQGHYLSHLGEWRCSSCKLFQPKNDIQKKDISSPLPGLYNVYNTMAATLAVEVIGGDGWKIGELLQEFSPAFGRQEEFEVDGKKVKIFLSKNPAGFNASLSTVLDLNPKKLLLVLNDRIPDGRDVSWIWDVDFEIIPQGIDVMVSGDRVYDLAVRIKYTLESQKSKVKSQSFDKLKIDPERSRMDQNYNSKLKIYEGLKEAIEDGLMNINKGETLFILPTYSAMLEVRKILRGRKIL